MGIEVSRTRIGPRFSEGARLLWQVMSDRKWSQGDLTRAISAKPGTASPWLYGDRPPSWDWAKTLRDTFEIPIEAWTLEPSEPFVPPAARELESGPSLPSVNGNAA